MRTSYRKQHILKSLTCWEIYTAHPLILTTLTYEGPPQTFQCPLKWRLSRMMSPLIINKIEHPASLLHLALSFGTSQTITNLISIILLQNRPYVGIYAQQQQTVKISPVVKTCQTFLFKFERITDCTLAQYEEEPYHC